MARTKERVELPAVYQLESLGRASVEARTIIHNASRILHTVDLSKVDPHSRALLLTITEDADSFLDRYYDLATSD
jgi:hypothetical protein